MQTKLRQWVISSTSTEELTERLDILLHVVDQELTHTKDKVEHLGFMVEQYVAVLGQVIEPPSEIHLES